MSLRLYDSSARAVRDFVPLQRGRVGIYLCGLTVQSEPHVGHVRSGVNFDVLRRWLTANGHEVHFIRNITDIEDKILARSAQLGRPWYNLAFTMRRELDAAYAALNVEPPTYEPAASSHIPEMIELISSLIDSEHAYRAVDGSDNVYFDVRRWPRYGELSGQRLDEMEAAEDADGRGKRDPRDFALWKAHKVGVEPATAAWPSPWGPGRPGWHIECSAMSLRYLGGAFDIHGGGIDLRFPHHENEQAQSRAAGFDFASYWMHNAWVTTAGEKMSKSLGNSLTIPSVLEHSRAIDLRFYLLAAHYRSHVEFSFEALAEAAEGFARIEHFLTRARDVLGDVEAGAWGAEFEAAMDADLGTPAAVAVVYDAVRVGNKLLVDGPSDDLRATASSVRAMLAVLGIDPLDARWSARGSSAREEKLMTAVDALVASLLVRREEARAAQDFATADAIRGRLAAAGIDLEDTASGPRWTL
jgi:cysteinyl-tRNA synthetase